MSVGNKASAAAPGWKPSSSRPSEGADGERLQREAAVTSRGDKHPAERWGRISFPTTLTHKGNESLTHRHRVGKIQNMLSLNEAIC